MIRQINERIAYIPASDGPLSADIGIVMGDSRLYLYDVGNGEKSLAELKGFLEEYPNREICCIFSHFHEDHTGNHAAFSYAKAFGGPHTVKYIPYAEPITAPVCIEDGVKVKILPLPSSHAKGCLALMVDDEFLFLGDGTYPGTYKGIHAYNRGVLLEELKLLESLPADKYLLSHKPRFIYPAKAVIRELRSVYDRRLSGEAYINA